MLWLEVMLWLLLLLMLVLTLLRLRLMLRVQYCAGPLRQRVMRSGQDVMRIRRKALMTAAMGRRSERRVLCHGESVVGSRDE